MIDGPFAGSYANFNLIPPGNWAVDNFSMIDNLGAVFGGTNDVEVTYDNTTLTDASDMRSNMTIESTNVFFGHLWTAKAVRVFGPGTYTFEACTPTSSFCTAPAPLVLKVGTGQLGAHMLFDWSTSVDIDVINVWSTTNDIFDDQGAQLHQLWTGPEIGPYPWSTVPDPTTATWGLASLDTDAEGNSDGIPGAPMIDGPFAGSYANFNLFGGSGEPCTTACDPPPPETTPGTKVKSCEFSLTPVSIEKRADWWLVAGFLGFMAWFRRRRNKA